jgi:Predicted dehydrogenase
MDYDVTVIGAGVVGLATARKLSESYGSVLIVDKEENFGRGISSRNSEVIHSGIYYKPNSLKAKLCVKGQSLLYKYCNKKLIQHNICGKLIIAQGDLGEKKLNDILINAQNNGVMTGRLCVKEEISELEPHIKAEYALYFPESGVIDSHQLMFNLLNDAKENGADIAYKVDVKKINNLDNGYEVIALDADLNKISFSTKILINSCGLFAHKVSEMVGIIEPKYQILNLER